MELSAERVLFRRGHPFFDMSGESYISLSELQRRIKSAVETALRNSGKFIPWQVVTLGRDGNILD